MIKPQALNQSAWMREYDNAYRPEFNDFLYRRDDYDTIEALKKVILSCERNLYFTIKVTNFRVVEDYDEIHQILFDYEQTKIDRNKSKSKRMENPYSFINVKDSDIMLLIVDYFLAINDPEKPEQDVLQVIIKVPRIVDKYYYRINGNMFFAIFQIVDGSTYNNTSSNSKKQSNTLKTIFMPTRLYRNTFATNDYYNHEVKYTTYVSRIFSKNVPVVEYFFAKYGLYGGLEYLGLQNVVTFSDAPWGDENDVYCFEKNGLYIEAPQYIFDRDLVTQCVVTTIQKHIIGTKTTLADLKSKEYWEESLAGRYGSKNTSDKGLAILESLESIYDITTHEDIRLPEKDKNDIYAILRWMLREFPALRLKENTDVSTKKIRRPEYMAAIYSTKLTKGIYLASDIKKKITMKDLRRYLYVAPDYLISKIVKDKLVSFKNNVNDNDGVYALKFSYKGVSGLGGDENGTATTIPDSYRQVDPSHLGRVDLDASSATDPGLTGIICPLAKIYKNSFAPKEYMEPNSWEEEFEQLVQQYRELKGQRDLVTFMANMPELLDVAESKEEFNVQLQNIDSGIAQCESALVAIHAADTSTEFCPTEITENGERIVYTD